VHEYVIPLNGRDGTAWLGQIDHLHVILPEKSDEPVQLTYAALTCETPEAPARLTRRNRTLEVLYGTQAPWSFRVPENGQLSVACVSAGLSESGMRGAVRFRVTLEPQLGPPIVLLERVSGGSGYPGWLDAQADLAAYANQAVTMRFDVDNLGDPDSDVAAWGAPLVFSRANDVANVPVVLVSCDTLRADGLGCYGHPRGTSPCLDQLAQDAIVFENAVVGEPWTLTSHMTMLTGLHRHHHGVNHTRNLPEARVTLSEALRAAGYLTGGFTGTGFWLLPWRGFQQGFDTYATPPPEDPGFQPVLDTAATALAWLEDHQTDRLFLFFHTYENHSKFIQSGYVLPYVPSSSEFVRFGNEMPTPPYTRKGQKTHVAVDFLKAANSGEIRITDTERAHMRAMYDDCTRLVDHAIGRIVECLESRGLYERSLIIVTADHGESFGEHGRYLHDELYETCIRVPLIVKLPHGRLAGTRVPHLVSNEDLFRTVLDVAGVPDSVATDGVNLLTALETPVWPRGEVHLFQQRGLVGVRTGEWKLVGRPLHDDYELYDLRRDPDEGQDCLGQFPQVARGLKERVTSFREPRYGWNFALHGGEATTRLLLTILAEKPIDYGELQDSEAVPAPGDYVTGDENGIRFRACFVSSPSDYDGLRLAGEGKRLAVSIELSGAPPLVVNVGSKPARESGRLSLTLDAADATVATVPPLPNQAVVPTLRIWYDAPTGPEGTSQSLTEEDRALMESMGYLAP
jgi:arylsulfatase A-like enzyme